MRFKSILLVLLLVLCFGVVANAQTPALPDFLDQWYGFYLPDGNTFLERIDAAVEHWEGVKEEIVTEYPGWLASMELKYGEMEWWAEFVTKAEAAYQKAITKIDGILEKLESLKEKLANWQFVARRP